ncbi:MAG TPA: sulfotransferase, partial [Paracoccus sp.]|nr:sulfotransferase [Paracoccus sp. (in: a-proteobacteria)]
MSDTLDPKKMAPLFILGCVRSGTTLVRNLLRRVPDTICPEETHYFRYGEPFRTDAFTRPILKSATLI